MTKVTSFEISRQLSRAGFKAEFDNFYDSSGNKINYESLTWGGISESDIPAYDLETMLDALPNALASNSCLELFLCVNKTSGKRRIGYYYGDFYGMNIAQVQEEGLSLADCAALVWLKLKEKGLLDESLSEVKNG